MPPIANFVCNSKKCRTAKGAPVYELPVKATHCPMGHRQIVRLFDQVRVNTGRQPDHFRGRATSSSMAARVDDLITEPVSAALAKRDELKEAARRSQGAPGTRWAGDNGMVRAVPTRNVNQELQRVYAGDAERVGANPNATIDPPTEKNRVKQGQRFDKGILGDMGRARAPIGQVIAKDPEGFRVAVHRDSEGKVVDVTGEKAG